jgi:hypothetical protein
LPASTFKRLDPDAYYLLTAIKFANWGRPRFALVPEAMEAAGTIPGWSRHRYRACRKRLLDSGDLIMVHAGGGGPRDPALFAFAG